MMNQILLNSVFYKDSTFLKRMNQLILLFLFLGFSTTTQAQQNALDFDGVNDYVSLTTNPLASSTDLTIELWYYPKSHNSWSRLLDFGDFAGDNMLLAASIGTSGVPTFIINVNNGGQRVLQAPSALALNQWSHIAVTLTGTTATMYINGLQVVQNTSFDINASNLGATVNNWLGRSQYSDAYLKGVMDELRIWNIARSQATIQANMNAELIGNEAGLVSYYQFNQGIATGSNLGVTALDDLTTTNNDGTFTNFALTGCISNFVCGNSALGGSCNIPVTPAPIISCPSNIADTNTFWQCGKKITYPFPSSSSVACPYSQPITGFTYLGNQNGKSYYVSTATANFATANAACFAAGGYLTQINDATENTFIQSILPTNCYIGYNDIDIEGTFTWSNGQSSAYTNWTAGEPNNNGGNEDATLLFTNGFWNDVPTTNGYFYLLEISGGTLIQTAGLSTGSLFPVGTTTNSFTLTDAAGNFSSCSFNVTISDTQDPVIAIAKDTVFNCFLNGQSVNLNYEVGAIDNCNAIPVQSSSPQDGNIWFYGGNPTGGGSTFDITATNSMVITSFDVGALRDGGGTVPYTIEVYYKRGSRLGFETNASAWTLANTKNFQADGAWWIPTTINLDGIAIPAGETYSIWIRGYSSTTTACLIFDNNALLIGDANFTTSNNAAAYGNFQGVNDGYHFVGNMGYSLAPFLNVTQTAGLPSGSAFPIGVTTNTFTATDAAGNVSTKSFTVTVNEDTTLPTLTAQSDFIRDTDAGLCTFTNAASSIAEGVAVDNCTIDSYEYVLTGATTGTVSTLLNQVFTIGVTTINWTATDANGNVSVSDEFTVTINNVKEIDVQGNAVSIVDGDNTPNIADETDFGIVYTNRTITYTLSNTGTEAITITSITSDNTHFVVSNVPASIAAGSSATFDVTFTPTSFSVQTAIITINNNDCDEAIYDFVVRARKPIPVSVLPTPSAPNNFIATAISTTQINLTWSAISSNITEYQLYQGGTLIATLPITTRTYQVTGLNPNTFYRFSLVAVNRSNGQIKTSTPVFAQDWTFPESPSLISVSEVCAEGKAVVKVNSSGNVYRIYDQLTGGNLLLESSNGEFQLPTTNQNSTFYIAVLGRDGDESERMPVQITVLPAFEALIVGESVQISCENTLGLQAQAVENATYKWYFNESLVAEGQELLAIYSGFYKVMVIKQNCSVVSEEVFVKLNQKPIAQIKQRNQIQFCENGLLNAVLVGQNATYEWSFNGIVIGNEIDILVSESGTYTLSVSQNGCQNSTEIQVIVTNTPQLPILEASENIICPETETTISIQNPENNVVYRWFRNGRNIHQTGNSISTSIKGVYQARAFASQNTYCTINSEELEINHFEVEPVYLRVSEDKKSLFLEDATLSQNEIASVEWYFEGEVKTNLGTTNQITPTEKGRYSAKVTNQNGCVIQTRTVYFSIIEVPIITGEEDLKEDIFKIYPNPSKGIFNIHFGNVLAKEIQITVFDGIGRNIHTQTLEKGSQDFTLKINKAAKGMYMIHFNQNGSTYSKQIIIE